MLINQKNLLGFILFSFCGFPYGGTALNLKTSNFKPNPTYFLYPTRFEFPCENPSDYFFVFFNNF